LSASWAIWTEVWRSGEPPIWDLERAERSLPISLVGVTRREGLEGCVVLVSIGCTRVVGRMRTNDLPAMVIKPTADSGLESVLAVKTVETACA
jgi:hypothetical protein